MNEMTPGQAACIAWNAHYAEEHGIEARNEWAASDQRGRDAWDAAAQAAIAAQPQSPDASVLRNYLDDFTHAVIDFSSDPKIIAASRALRKKTGMEPF